MKYLETHHQTHLDHLIKNISGKTITSTPYQYPSKDHTQEPSSSGTRIRFPLIPIRDINTIKKILSKSKLLSSTLNRRHILTSEASDLPNYESPDEYYHFNESGSHKIEEDRIHEEELQAKKLRRMKEMEWKEERVRQRRMSSELWNRIDTGDDMGTDVNLGMKELSKKINIISKETSVWKILDGTLIMYFSVSDISQNPQDYKFHIERKALVALGIAPSQNDALAYEDYDTRRIAIFGNFLIGEVLYWFNKEYMEPLAKGEEDIMGWDELLKAFLTKFDTARNTFHAQTAVRS